MTMQKSFKRLVRSRMEKTGESYTAARAVLLAAEESAVVEGPPLATSDEAIRQRTGRGWEEWFDLLDEWGAAERPHKEVARRVAAELGIEPLAWNAQAITMSYERARGLRVVGERSDGFAVTAQRTVAVPVERLFDSFVDRSLRGRWLADDELRERTATKPKSARFRLGRRRDPGQCHLPGEGRQEQHGGRRARAACRCRRGRADEGLLARAPSRTQVAARGR